MTPPRTVKLRKLKKLLRPHGISLQSGGKHLLFVSPDGRKYPIPAKKDGDDVERVYVNGIRRAFGLTEEDGVSDEEFYREL